LGYSEKTAFKSAERISEQGWFGAIKNGNGGSGVDFWGGEGGLRGFEMVGEVNLLNLL